MTRQPPSSRGAAGVLVNDRRVSNLRGAPARALFWRSIPVKAEALMAVVVQDFKLQWVSPSGTLTTEHLKLAKAGILITNTMNNAPMGASIFCPLNPCA